MLNALLRLVPNNPRRTFGEHAVSLFVYPLLKAQGAKNPPVIQRCGSSQRLLLLFLGHLDVVFVTGVQLRPPCSRPRLSLARPVPENIGFVKFPVLRQPSLAVSAVQYRFEPRMQMDSCGEGWVPERQSREKLVAGVAIRFQGVVERNATSSNHVVLIYVCKEVFVGTSLFPWVFM